MTGLGRGQVKARGMKANRTAAVPRYTRTTATATTAVSTAAASDRVTTPAWPSGVLIALPLRSAGPAGFNSARTRCDTDSLASSLTARPRFARPALRARAVTLIRSQARSPPDLASLGRRFAHAL